MDAQASLIDLDERRDVGGILNGAFSLYRARFGLFATIAFAVVLPLDLLVYGVAGEWLWTDYEWDDAMPIGAEIASYFVPLLVTTPLVTAGHVHAVMDLGAGRETSAGRALGAAARRFPAVAVAVACAGIGATLGLVFLIVPGIYLWTRWIFTSQAVVAENRGPLEGIERSGQLVKGQWWRVFGISLLIYTIGFIMAVVLQVPLTVAGYVAEIGTLVLLGQIIGDAITLSFAALAGTLLYFDARARR